MGGKKSTEGTEGTLPMKHAAETVRKEDKMKRSRTLANLVAILLLSSSPSLAEIGLNSEIVDQYALSIQSDRFSFSDSGELQAGPIRAPGQPIDFSSIIKEAYLQGGFIDSITGCFSGIDYCDFEVRRLKVRQVSIDTVIEDQQSEIDAAKIISIAKSTIGDLGFTITQRKIGIPATITVIHGSEAFLRDKAGNRSVSLALKALDNWIDEGGNKSIIQGGWKKPFCYLSSKDWSTSESLQIYIGSDGIDGCLPQSYFSAIGLYPTLFETPSLGNLSMRYSVPTFADRLYVSILYHHGFPIDGDQVSMARFWDENAVSVWKSEIQRELDDGQ